MTDSTPTTAAEYNAALELVDAAQEPLPWDPPCYWPRILGQAALPQLAVYDTDNDNMLVYFDMTITSTSPTTAQFEVGSPHADPAKCYRCTVTGFDADTNEAVIACTPSGDVLNQPPYVLWDPEQDPGNEWEDGEDRKIQGFQLQASSF